MSRIGKQPIKLPSGVSVTEENGRISVSGPKGTLSEASTAGISVKTSDDEIHVTRASDDRLLRSKHGLIRTLVQNMVTGVSEEFTKKLEVNGVGFRVALQGNKLVLSVGLSHPVEYTVPEGITVKVEQNTITISGISKQQVGQAAAEIRSIRKPEPYKGKGIKYDDERIIRKSGKSGKEGA